MERGRERGVEKKKREGGGNVGPWTQLSSLQSVRNQQKVFFVHNNNGRYLPNK